MNRVRFGEPQTIVLNGQDAVSYILSANIHRRNLTKGQAAMIMAKVVSVSDTSIKQFSKLTQLPRTRLTQANVVLEFASELADGVVAGTTPLDQAYQIALDRKAALNSTEKQLERLKAQA